MVVQKHLFAPRLPHNFFLRRSTSAMAHELQVCWLTPLPCQPHPASCYPFSSTCPNEGGCLIPCSFAVQALLSFVRSKGKQEFFSHPKWGRRKKNVLECADARTDAKNLKCKLLRLNWSIHFAFILRSFWAQKCVFSTPLKKYRLLNGSEQFLLFFGCNYQNIFLISFFLKKALSDNCVARNIPNKGITQIPPRPDKKETPPYPGAALLSLLIQIAVQHISIFLPSLCLAFFFLRKHSLRASF